MEDLDWDSVGRSDIVEEKVTDEAGDTSIVATIDIDLLKFGRDDDGQLAVSDGEVGLDDLRTIVTVRSWINADQELEIELLYYDDEDWIDQNEDIQGEISAAAEEMTKFFSDKAGQ